MHPLLLLLESFLGGPQFAENLSEFTPGFPPFLHFIGRSRRHAGGLPSFFPRGLARRQSGLEFRAFRRRLSILGFGFGNLKSFLLGLGHCLGLLLQIIRNLVRLDH